MPFTVRRIDPPQAFASKSLTQPGTKGHELEDCAQAGMVGVMHELGALVCCGRGLRFGACH